MVDEAVGCERPLAPVRPERLPPRTLTFELLQVQTDGRRLHAEQHVQLGEPLGVVEELRVRLRPLTATRDRLTTHERVRGAGRPVVERRRSLVTVGTAPAEQTETGQPFGAVAKRPGGCVGEETFELGLRQHALLAEQREQTPVESGEGRERVAPAQPAGVPAASTHVELDQG
jgi:hypothetical protein